MLFSFDGRFPTLSFLHRQESMLFSFEGNQTLFVTDSDDNRGADDFEGRKQFDEDERVETGSPSH